MFRHVGIVVSNIKLQLAFYSGLLGLIVYSDEVEEGAFLESILGITGARARIVKLGREGNIIVELLGFDHTERGNQILLTTKGITHFAITVDDIDYLYEELSNYDLIEFISQPETSPSGKHRVCFVKDPEGNHIELVQEL